MIANANEPTAVDETAHAELPVPSSAKRTGNSEATFAETALKLGGKSDEEVRRMGAMDKADDQVESLFNRQHQTSNSPIHRAVWENEVPVELFASEPVPNSPQAAQIMRDSLQVVEENLFKGTLHDDRRKIRNEVLQDLGRAGYWGLLVGKDHGGAETPFSQFAPFLTKMAQFDPTIAGLASVHGCIGAVDPLQTFGTPEQKQRFLPKLASGERLSAFALTEPCAGSDLTALRTTAVKKGDTYYVTGEKLFITNVTPGRTIGLVCLIEGKPAVLIVDLPSEENDMFQLKQYGLYALKHTHNQGIVFKDLPVPAENLLDPRDGDGLSIAYHGLNRGRVALCANAAGTMRLMLANMLPWGRFRKTYGQAIETRELVQRRMGHLAGLIVACDALTEWTASLLDHGYRGEMECIIAKIFGSEAQKEAAIELFMKTHGGRSFLHGHLFGDNVHEFLAPCIYEGEGEMLGMAFFKSLVKQHGRQFFEPIGMALAANGIKNPNMANPRHLWALKKPLMNYGKWFVQRSMHRPRYEMPSMPDRLRSHAEFAASWLQHSASEISGTMRKFQLKLADRQCRMAELSGRVQLAVVILCTTLYATRQKNDVITEAADTICQELRRRMKGGLPSDRYFKQVTTLGRAISEGHFPGLDETPQAALMMPYQNR